MRLDFLGASDGTRLTKTFKELAPGQYQVDSYPHVANFNSFSREINGLQDFHDNIVAHANEGLCLLKGKVKNKLCTESRAGSTDPHELTSWLCLDIDIGIKGPLKAFVESLDPAFVGVGFIAQASSSQGIKSSTDEWRGHVYILLEQPVSPQILKNWLISRNLELSMLRERLELSAGGLALRYPLDVTTCQNDKLIYIAPPNCTNFEDPMLGNRFEVVQGEKEFASFVPQCSSARLAAKSAEFISTKRKEAGLQPKRANLSTHPSGVEILKNPDPVDVTGKKEARGFVYVNLDGGDSWAYFFPIDRPEILSNFKGEPGMRLKDVAPELYAEYNKPSVPGGIEQKGGAFQPFVCRDLQTDCYYNGIYRESTQSVELHPCSSKGKLEDFMAQYGQTMDKHVVDWEIVFDPRTDKVIDFDRRWVNKYSPSIYTRKAQKLENTKIPVVINRVLDSLCGDETTKEHFINWLAALFQTRSKLGTAWVFQGVQGTGKGLLFSRILQPLLGHKHCHETTMDRFDDQFNSYLETNLLLFIDEANVQDNWQGDRTLEKLKNMITEEEIMIRAMRANPKAMPSFSNLVFASNQTEMIRIEESDRRLNVGPRQELPLRITHEEVTSIADELQNFADYLQSYEVNMPKARKVLLNKARLFLIEAGRTTLDTFFSSVKTGNLDYFTQYLRNNPPGDPSGLKYVEFEAIVHRWVESVDTPMTVKREDLQIAYEYMQGTKGSVSPTKFSRMCSKHNVPMEPCYSPTGSIRGLKDHTWTLTSEGKDAVNKVAHDNITPIRK